MQDRDREIAALITHGKTLESHGDHVGAQSAYGDAWLRMDIDDPRYSELKGLISPKTLAATTQRSAQKRRSAARVYAKSSYPFWRRNWVRWGAIAALVLLELGMLLAKNAQVSGAALSAQSNRLAVADAVQSDQMAPAPAPVFPATPTPLRRALPTATMLPFQVLITAVPTIFASPIPPTPTLRATATPAPSLSPTATNWPTQVRNQPGPVPTDTPPPAAPPPTVAPQSTPVPPPPPPPSGDGNGKGNGHGKGNGNNDGGGHD